MSSGIRARVGAEAFAATFGKVTLEMTLTGKVLDSLARAGAPISSKTWDWASRRFAAAATEARVFVGNGGLAQQTSTWLRVEAPELMRRGVDPIVEVWE